MNEIDHDVHTGKGGLDALDVEEVAGPPADAVGIHFRTAGNRGASGQCHDLESVRELPSKRTTDEATCSRDRNPGPGAS